MEHRSIRTIKAITAVCVSSRKPGAECPCPLSVRVDLGSQPRLFLEKAEFHDLTPPDLRLRIPAVAAQPQGILSRECRADRFDYEAVARRAPIELIEQRATIGPLVTQELDERVDVPLRSVRIIEPARLGAEPSERPAFKSGCCPVNLNA